MKTVTDFIFLGSKITADGDCSHEIKRHLLLGRKAMTNLDSILKSRDITLPTKAHLVRAMVFPVVIHGCESWTIKKAERWRIDVFEKLWWWRRLLRVPWTARRSNHPKGNQSWIFTGRTDGEAEAPILWPSDAKNRLIGTDPDAGKDWGQEAKRATEHEMVGWHHWLNEHELQQTLGDDEGQGTVVCCSPWGCKESDTTEQWRIMLVHCLPMIMAKVSNEQRKEKEMKRQDWKGKRRARGQLLDQTFSSVGWCHHQSTGRKGKWTEFIKVRSSESACNAGDPDSIPGSGRSPGEGIGYPLQ